MCGCGRTSMPTPERNSTGPKWSKKMNGPTMRDCALGSARRISKPPRSTVRGTTTCLIASHWKALPGAGSLAGKKLMAFSCVREPIWAPAPANSMRLDAGQAYDVGDALHLRRDERFELGRRVADRHEAKLDHALAHGRC